MGWIGRGSGGAGRGRGWIGRGNGGVGEWAAGSTGEGGGGRQSSGFHFFSNSSFSYSVSLDTSYTLIFLSQVSFSNQHILYCISSLFGISLKLINLFRARYNHFTFFF